jgi:hypothetical protein
MRPLHPAGGPPDWAVPELTNAPRGRPRWSSGHSGLVLKVCGVRIGRIRWVGGPWDPKKVDWKAVVRRWKHMAPGVEHLPVSLGRANRPITFQPRPYIRSASHQEHASKVQYSTQANGGFEVTDLGIFGSLLKAGIFKDAEDPQELRKELEEKRVV